MSSTISDNEIRELFTDVNATDWEAFVGLKELQDSVAYQGFDPKHIASLICQKLKAAGKTKEEIREAIKVLIVLGVERGNNWAKIKGTLQPKGLAVIDPIASVIGLRSNVGTHRQDAITLARVCMSFPLATLSYMPKAVRPAVSPALMSNEFTGYPAAICHGCFSSLIPRGCRESATTF